MFNYIYDIQPTIWSNQLLYSLLITGILATLLGIGAMVWAQKILSPSRTAIIFSLEPVFAALFAMLIIGDYLSIKEWAGGLLIIIGVIYSEAGDD